MNSKEIKFIKDTVGVIRDESFKADTNSRMDINVILTECRKLSYFFDERHREFLKLCYSLLSTDNEGYFSKDTIMLCFEDNDIYQCSNNKHKSKITKKSKINWESIYEDDILIRTLYHLTNNLDYTRYNIKFDKAMCLYIEDKETHDYFYTRITENTHIWNTQVKISKCFGEDIYNLGDIEEA